MGDSAEEKSFLNFVTDLELVGIQHSGRFTLRLLLACALGSKRFVFHRIYGFCKRLKRKPCPLSRIPARLGFANVRMKNG